MEIDLSDSGGEDNNGHQSRFAGMNPIQQRPPQQQFQQPAGLPAFLQQNPNGALNAPPQNGHNHGPSQNLRINDQMGIQINAGQGAAGAQVNNNDKMDQDDGGSFDNASDGVGSDNEIGVNAGIHQLNQVRQADKNIFAQQRLQQMDSGQVQSHRREFLQARGAQVPGNDDYQLAQQLEQTEHLQAQQAQNHEVAIAARPELKEFLEVFPEADVVILADVYDQLNGNRDLVMEFLLNGKLSDRVLQGLEQQQQRQAEDRRGGSRRRQNRRQQQRSSRRNQASAQRERSAFEEDEAPQRQSNARGGAGEESPQSFDADDKDAEFARKLQEQEYEEARRAQQQEEQKKIEREIRRQQQQASQRPSQARGAAGIQNVYELRSPTNELQNVQALDDSSQREAEKKYDHNVDINDDYANYQKQKNQPKAGGGGFFSMFCGCFATNNRQKQKDGNAPQPRPQGPPNNGGIRQMQQAVPPPNRASLYAVEVLDREVSEAGGAANGQQAAAQEQPMRIDF
ncbi:hypothetical protein FGO68_gene17373 [Halteria grandinella]|uniref:CUE domain-containing protein n=1 Tax=Halteria grandinella TaxID=5974 RepID=A0A8J8NTS1_HALGN|nr:hypothetical protein FGO68_gene17373 [Halteria grandinella]